MYIFVYDLVGVFNILFIIEKKDLYFLMQVKVKNARTESLVSLKSAVENCLRKLPDCVLENKDLKSL